jgi:hypothetical protein
MPSGQTQDARPGTHSLNNSATARGEGARGEVDVGLRARCGGGFDVKPWFPRTGTSSAPSGSGERRDSQIPRRSIKDMPVRGAATNIADPPESNIVN